MDWVLDMRWIDWYNFINFFDFFLKRKQTQSCVIEDKERNIITCCKDIVSVL